MVSRVVGEKGEEGRGKGGDVVEGRVRGACAEAVWLNGDQVYRSMASRDGRGRAWDPTSNG